VIDGATVAAKKIRSLLDTPINPAM